MSRRKCLSYRPDNSVMREHTRRIHVAGDLLHDICTYICKRDARQGLGAAPGRFRQMQRLVQPLLNLRVTKHGISCGRDISLRGNFRCYFSAQSCSSPISPVFPVDLSNTAHSLTDSHASDPSNRKATERSMQEVECNVVSAPLEVS